MLNSITKTIISSAIIITPFLATSQVQAADENNYDSSSCITIFGTATLNSWGALENNSSTSTLGVRCPIQRDRNHKLLDSADSFVLVRDHTNSGRVSCTIRHNLLGSLNTITSQSITASTDTAFSSTAYRQLTFPARSFTNANEGSFYLYCTIPPRQTGNLASSINSFHIDED